MIQVSRRIPRLAAPIAICFAVSLPITLPAYGETFKDAELALPDTFYALNAKDAQYVLEKLWDNPPDDSILGLIMPAGLTPFDDASWAATITFDDIGYVSDDDAAGYN